MIIHTYASWPRRKCRSYSLIHKLPSCPILLLSHYDYTRRSCLDITVAGSPSPAASEDEDESCTTTGNAASNHAGNHRSNHGSGTKKGRQKRGVLPKQATSIMRTWLFQHLVVSGYRNNYPTLLPPLSFDRNLYDLCIYVASLPNRRRETSNRHSDKLDAATSEQLVYQCPPTDPSAHVGRCWRGCGIARRKTP